MKHSVVRLSEQIKINELKSGWSIMLRSARVKSKTLPVVLEVRAFLCHLAVDLVDNANNDGVGQCWHQPEVVGAVSRK